MTAATRLVVDASVVLKWFVADDERSVEEALDLLRAHAEGVTTLAAPEHMRLEVLNALRWKPVSQRVLVAASRQLEGFGLDWFPLDAALTEQASLLAVRHGLTLYDAAYVALAKRLETALVTADRRVAECKGCRTRLL